MKMRHKTPSIFSLSMVDMLCCALGCVITVWLLNAKLSEDEAAEQESALATLRDSIVAERSKGERLEKGAGELTDRLARALKELEKLRTQVSDLTAAEKILRDGLADATRQVKELTESLLASGKKVTALEGTIRNNLAKMDEEKARSGKIEKGLAFDVEKARLEAKAEREKAERLQKLVDAKLADLVALERKLADAGKTRAMLDTSITERDKELAALRLMKTRYEQLLEREKALDRKILEQLAMLAEADKSKKKSEKERKDALDDVEKERLALQQLRKLRLDDLARLEKEKLVLRAAADNRFAGIALTGKRVIFLVDTSGSMTMIDNKTDAPDKWPEVCRTVSQLMASMPDLEKFQVITFAVGAGWPMKHAGEWIDYDAKTSPEAVRKALAAIVPEGGTNMYVALDAAFKLRASGLDAVYVMSDGLPNRGEGLTDAQRATLSDADRGPILGRHIRTTLRDTWNAPHARRPKVKINTIGFFFESPDLGSFLWALARENEGSFVGMSKP